MAYSAQHGLRGLLALFVSFCHFSMWSVLWPRSNFDHVTLIATDHAAVVVDSFFMFSGFILTFVYGERVATGGKARYAEFFLGRVGRILPLYFFTLFAYWAVYVLSDFYSTVPSNYPNHDGLSFVYSLLIIQAWGVLEGVSWNGPTWSVSTEWIAYFAFPMIAILLTRYRSGHWMLLGVVVALYALLSFDSKFEIIGSMHYGWQSILRCFAGFALGAILFRLSSRLLEQAPVDRWVYSALQIVSALALAYNVHTGGYYIVSVFAAALLIFATSTDKGVLSAVFALPPFRRIADMAFSIYLNHSLIILIMRTGWFREGFVDVRDLESRLAQVAVLVGYFAAVIAWSWVTYTCIEEPARRYFKRIGRRGKSASAEKEAPAAASTGATPILAAKQNVSPRDFVS